MYIVIICVVIGFVIVGLLALTVAVRMVRTASGMAGDVTGVQVLAGVVCGLANAVVGFWLLDCTSPSLVTKYLSFMPLLLPGVLLLFFVIGGLVGGVWIYRLVRVVLFGRGKPRPHAGEDEG